MFCLHFDMGKFSDNFVQQTFSREMTRRRVVPFLVVSRPTQNSCPNYLGRHKCGDTRKDKAGAYVIRVLISLICSILQCVGGECRLFIYFMLYKSLHSPLTHCNIIKIYFYMVNNTVCILYRQN